MTEFVRDDTLEFIAFEQFEGSARDRDRGVAWRIASCKRVDAAFLFEHVDFRYGHARRDCHFLNDVTQTTAQRILRIGGDRRSAQLLGDGAATGRQHGCFEHAGAENEQYRQQSSHCEYARVIACETPRRRAIARIREEQQGEANDDRDARNDQPGCNNVGSNQATRHAPCLILCSEEVHALADSRGDQVNDTSGASRISSDSISRKLAS